ncbi:hypothetical protein BTH42_23610 [Burkholderia sp. SRS-W-2-2016]|uniref:amidohydrolase family protein n=1 Tax=Burkholderia sp. SRS-W-2-2016 TaxID=1926878 RepID=UPI00094B3054|nr:amidohydrolase family protein [Burkholderia sp. SRS-W-2-2016]OLL29243.1 hypothetical protein BTH42_23610 [Burkholderia sp. SRS-W-2-2016]
MLIDAHHHLWRIARNDYGWLTPDTGFLYRDYEPADFKPILDAHGIERAVLIQAAPAVAETDFLLSLADQHPWLGAVVGWVDLSAGDAPQQLDRLAKHPRFRGVRPMIQDIADDNWMLRAELNDAFVALAQRDLSFDALIQPRHLRALIELVERHPSLRIAINHCGKPEVRDWHAGDASFNAWQAGMTELARHPNVFCKLSALPTRAAPNWNAATFAPYVDVLMSAFGAGRLMWASDWPILERNGRYPDWFRVARELVPEADHARVFGATAQSFYRIV